MRVYLCCEAASLRRPIPLLLLSLASCQQRERENERALVDSHPTSAEDLNVNTRNVQTQKRGEKPRERGRILDHGLHGGIGEVKPRELKFSMGSQTLEMALVGSLV